MYTLYSTAYTVLQVLNTVQLPFKSLQYSIYSTVGVEHCTVPLQKMYSTAYTVGIVQCTVQFNYKRFTVLYRIYGRSCTVLRQEMYSTEYTVGIVQFTTGETVQKILTVLFSSPAKAAQYRNSTYFLFLNEKHVNRHLKKKKNYFQNEVTIFVQPNFVTANEILFICRGKCYRNRRQKMRQAIQIKIQESRRGKKTGFDAQSPGKGGPVTGSKNSIMVKEFFVRPTHPPSGSKNVIFCFLANMRYIRDGICTGHIRRRVYFSVPAG